MASKDLQISDPTRSSAFRSGERFIFARHFRLQGTIDGTLRTFSLKPGTNSVGRAGPCDVRLPVAGVSQRHADLVVGPDGLRLEDLRSKNGSFVNGSRITSAPLSPGDELWFGSAVLLLEEVEEEEERLAFELPIPETQDPSLSLGDTPTRASWLAAATVRAWLSSISAGLDHLADGPQQGLQEVAEILASATGAEGVSFLEVSSAGEPPILLAACGTVGDQLQAGPPEPSWVEGSEGAEGIRFWTTAPGAEPMWATATLQLGGGRCLILGLLGNITGRWQTEPLLAAHLKIAGHLRQGVAEASRRPHAPPRGLVLPPGYVPGASLAMAELHRRLEPLVGSDLPVLVVGETGAGKELVAEILHTSSRRRKSPFVAINCAALPAELLEAELFGIGKGVATGVGARPGRFLEAQGGTLLLDEIGDLPAALQPKLLRVLETGQIQPVGSPPVALDVRVVAATNADLLGRVEAGTFRADLYYRLAGATLRVPPLRQRRKDIPALVEHYLRQFIEESGKAVRGVTVKAMGALVSYPWPGNVRELIHEVRRLAYACPERGVVEASLLAEHITGPEQRSSGTSEDSAAESVTGTGAKVPLEAWLRASKALDLGTLEGAALAEALRRTGGNQVQAARLLGISRMALRRRLEQNREKA